MHLPPSWGAVQSKHSTNEIVEIPGGLLPVVILDEHLVLSDSSATHASAVVVGMYCTYLVFQPLFDRDHLCGSSTGVNMPNEMRWQGHLQPHYWLSEQQPNLISSPHPKGEFRHLNVESVRTSWSMCVGEAGARCRLSYNVTYCYCVRAREHCGGNRHLIFVQWSWAGGSRNRFSLQTQIQVSQK